MSTPVSLLNGSYGKYVDKIDLDLLLRLDGLYVNDGIGVRCFTTSNTVTDS